MATTARDWADVLDRYLDEAPPSEVLAAQTGGDLIDLIAATERLKGRLAAVQARAEAAFWDQQLREQERLEVPRNQRGRGIADQIALARHISPKQASDEVALHRVMLTSLPSTTQLLEAGRISEYAARKVAENVLVLDDEDRARVDADLADQLPTVTARRAGDLARARAQELDADAAVRRHQRAVADRRVSLQPGVDGMSILRATLPLRDGVAVLKALTETAKKAKAAGDARSKGQIMADALTGRCCGVSEPDGIGVEIQLLMTDMTLLGDEEATAWVDGHPLPGRVARDLALGVRPGDSARDVTERPSDAPGADGHQAPRTGSPPEVADAARWIRRLYTDRRTGELTAVDGRRRLFRGAVRRFILLRDQRCRTPWCDAAIHDIDHAHPHAAGGATDAHNGVGHCQRFNQVKEMPGWVSRPEPAADGRPSRLTIQTPTGHRYVSTSPLLRRLLEGPDGERASILREEPTDVDPDPAPGSDAAGDGADEHVGPGTRGTAVRGEGRASTGTSSGPDDDLLPDARAG